MMSSDFCLTHMSARMTPTDRRIMPTNVTQGTQDFSVGIVCTSVAPMLMATIKNVHRSTISGMGKGAPARVMLCLRDAARAGAVAARLFILPAFAEDVITRGSAGTSRAKHQPHAAPGD